MIIDHSYFTQGLLTIPNLNQAYVVRSVNNYISLYEDELLSKALGESLKAAFLAGMEADTPDERWQKLVDGFVFDTASDTKVAFAGLAPENTLKMGTIAPYVFFHFMRDNLTQFTGNAVVATASENSGAASALPSAATVWNTCAKQVRILWHYLQLNAATYPEWKQSEINVQSFANINQFGI